VARWPRVQPNSLTGRSCYLRSMSLADLLGSLDAVAGDGALRVEPFLATCRLIVPIIGARR